MLLALFSGAEECECLEVLCARKERMRQEGRNEAHTYTHTQRERERARDREREREIERNGGGKR